MSGKAGHPVRRALELDALDRRLHPLLPQPLAAHARLANVDGNRLIYLVDSPLWNAKLRVESERILEAARSIGLKVDQVVIKTRTRPVSTVSSPGTADTADAPARTLSATATRALQSALDTLRASSPATPGKRRRS